MHSLPPAGQNKHCLRNKKVVLILNFGKFAVLTMLLSSLLCLPVNAQTRPDTAAESGILTVAETGEVLWEKSAQRKMAMASTTKMMTALVALEQADPDSTVTILPEWTGIEGSSMYLKAGEQYTLRQLLQGMMLVSGNDAATAVACAVSGSEEAFVQLMNEKARDLGLTDTHFENPHGLDGEEHYSTARDLARLAGAAMENPAFEEIVGMSSCTIGNQTYVNHNKLLRQCPGVIGVKTGYTKSAGRILVSCCQREGLRLICVTLRDPQDWADHSALYDWAYGTYHSEPVLTAEPLPALPAATGRGETVSVVPARPISVVTDGTDRITVRLYLPRMVFPGVQCGEPAGTARVYRNGILYGEYPLQFGSDLPLPERKSLYRRAQI